MPPAWPSRKRALTRPAPLPILPACAPTMPATPPTVSAPRRWPTARCSAAGARTPRSRRWGDGETFDADGLADPRVARWIVSCGGAPFAYLQDYDVHGWPDHHFADLPAPSRGIDQFIGSPAMRDRGHGARMVAAHLRRLVAAGARVVATDPHPDNARAIACYRRAGFHVAGPARDSAWGRILPMHAGPDASRATP